MRSAIVYLLFLANLIAYPTIASAACSSYPNILTNGTTADASQVMEDFNCAALTSDSTINNLTLTGSTALPGSGVIDNNGVINARNYVLPSISTTPEWARIGTFTAGQNGSTIRIVAYIHQGYNASNQQDSVYFISFKTSNSISVDGNGFAGNSNWYAVGFSAGISAGNIKWQANAPGVAATSYDLYILLPQYTANSHYAVTVSSSATWTNIGTSGAMDPGTASASVLIPTTLFNIPVGNVGINQANPTYTFQVNGSVAGTSAYVNLSDKRLKKDIHPINGALNKIKQIQGVEFHWRTPIERPIGKDIKLPTDTAEIGFLAQDIQKVLPEAVTIANDKDGTMSVAESKIVPLLVEAIKELELKNTQQSTQLADLKERLNHLEQERQNHVASE